MRYASITNAHSISCQFLDIKSHNQLSNEQRQANMLVCEKIFKIEQVNIF